MEIVAHDSETFFEVASSWMSLDPFTTNVIGVHLRGVLSGRIPANPDDLWLTIVENDTVVGIAMHTPPFP
jgi:hypothetical protein